MATIESSPFHVGLVKHFPDNRPRPESTYGQQRKQQAELQPYNSLTASKASYTTPTTTGGGVFFSGPSATAPITTADSVHFGFLKSTRNGNGKNGHVPNAAYRVLSRTPKTDIHVHQSGSTPLSILRTELLEKIYEGRVEYLEKVDHDTGKIETINLKKEWDRLSAQGKEAEYADLINQLTKLDVLRNAYRVLVSKDRQQFFRADDLIFDLAPGASVSDQQAELMAKGLLNYRSTSSRINPLVKNAPIAYESSQNVSKEIATGENVRYFEYRVSASGDFLKAPSVENDPVLLEKMANGTLTTEESSKIKRLHLEELVDRVNEGFQHAKSDLAKTHTAFDYGMIILFERNDTPEKAMAMAHKVIKLRQQGYPIVGVDLAGGELVAPVTLFKDAFQIIKDYNDDPKTPVDKRIGITIHAGETARSCTKSADEEANHNLKNPPNGEIHLSGPDSIKEAIHLAWSPNTPVRIGHGLQLVNSSKELQDGFKKFIDNPKSLTRSQKKRIINSSPLLKEIIDKGIVLEMCPKSNVQTIGVIYHTGHPAVFLSRLGVKVTLSTDNRTISDTHAPKEYVKIFQHSNAKYSDFKKMVLNGFEGAFIHDTKAKEKMIRETKQRMARNEGSVRYQVGIYQLNHHFKNPNPLGYVIIGARVVAAAPRRLWYNLRVSWTETHQHKHENPFMRPNINGDGK